MAVTLDDLINSFSGSSSAKGAALGALMSGLLSAYKPPGGVNLGVDMSKIGAIPGRTTTYTPRYVPAAEYAARDVTAPMTAEARRAFGVPTGIGGLGAMSQYTARPSMASMAPVSVTSPGMGAGALTAPTLTPRGSNEINPVLGALLGAAVGSIIPNPVQSGAPAAGGSGSGSSNFWGNAYDYVKQLVGFAEGGLATPLMADGGQASYYTYGNPVNPRDIMNAMAHGGEAKHGGLHVPVVEGRHDYRAGARVSGQGDGQSDDIPAMLADGEFVVDSETVAQLGNGSTKAGSELLDEFRKAVREHKRSAPVDKIPPASSPLQYMKTAMQRVKVKK